MVTRQREWQKRKQEEGRCIICGDKATVACYCDVHHESRMKKLRSRRGSAYRPQQCSRCGGIGHNSRTCQRYTEEFVEGPEVKPRRRVVRCEACGEPGHTRATCAVARFYDQLTREKENEGA